jgi:hypothetical protein
MKIPFRNIIIGTLFVVAGVSSLVSADDNIGNPVYGVFSETYSGIKYKTLNPGSKDGGMMGQWGATLDPELVISTEGTTALKVTDGSPTLPQGGVYIQFGYNGTYASPMVPTKMSDYAGGSMDFMIRTSTEIIVKVVWRDNNGKDVGVDRLLKRDYGVVTNNQWQRVSIPLSSLMPSTTCLLSIVQPAVFATLYVPAPRSLPARVFYLDNIVWRRSTSGTLSAVLKNTLDNETTTQITWSNVALGTTKWKAANQYIELKMNYYHTGWGIQIFTDNKPTAANPRYTGTGNPVGLVASYDTTTALPMCWRIVDASTTTCTIKQGAAGYPDRLWSAELGSNYPCFFWMMDKGTTGFADSDDYVTVWDNRGIHHAEGPTWGGATSPNYIYLGADFTGGVAPSTYQTSRLMVELFYE